MKANPLLSSARIKLDEHAVPRRIACRIPAPQAGTPEEKARAILAQLAEPLQLPAQGEALRLVHSRTTSTGTFVRFEQLIGGVPVQGGDVLVHVDRSGFARHVHTNHQLPERITTTAAKAKVTAARAERVLREAVGEPFTIRPKGALRADKVYLPTGRGLRLAWRVVANTLKPAHDWQAFVDAETGELLVLEDRLMNATGSGMVFNPNPVVTLNDNSIRDGITPEATLNGEASSQPLLDIAAPVGGNYNLNGPFCRIAELAAPAIGIPAEAAATGFNYSRTDDSFEAVNVYFHIDSIQRFIQGTLGIDDAHNSVIVADPHDNSINAAWYSPGTKDLHFSDSGSSRPDRAEDSDCMAHEYQHAIQDDMVPGWGNPVPGTTRYESRAIGEGCGDIMAVLYNVLLGDGYQRQVMEDWVFVDQDLGDGLRGLRRVDQTKLYSAFSTAADFYSNSQIWAGALWNIFLALGGDSATVADWEEPRNVVLQSMLASNRLLTTSASMPDAAEALMETNEALEDRCGRALLPMIDELHDRGVLSCQPGSDLKLTKLWSQRDCASVRSWEQVEFGQDNWFYAEIANQGAVAARALVVTFSFKSPFSTPVYPADFRDSTISAVAEFDLAPGETRTVWGRWPKERIPAIPAGQTSIHGCIMAEIYNPVDHVAPGVVSIGASNGKLRQCNTNVVDLLPDEAADFDFHISGFHLVREELVRLEVIRPPRWPELPVLLSHRDPNVIDGLVHQARARELEATPLAGEVVAARPTLTFLEPARIALPADGDGEVVLTVARGSSLSRPALAAARAAPAPEFVRCDAVAARHGERSAIAFRPGPRAGFAYLMRPRDRTTLRVTVRAPADAVPGDRFAVQFVQRNAKGELVGGFDVNVRVVAKKPGRPLLASAEKAPPAPGEAAPAAAAKPGAKRNGVKKNGVHRKR